MTTQSDPQRPNVFRLAQLRPSTKTLANGKNHWDSATKAAVLINATTLDKHAPS